MAAQDKVSREMIVAAFHDLRAAFPQWQMELELAPVLLLKIPQQAGLVSDVALSLEGDELHFAAGHFRAGWLPASEERILDLYRVAVYNWLCGEFRILEHSRGGKVVKAELQRPLDTGEWRTIESWSKLSLPFSRQPVTTKVLQNPTTGPRPGGA